MEPVIRKIFQLGIVVKDVKATMKRYEEFYGISNWTFTDGEIGFPPEEKAVNLVTRGVPGDFEISIASAMVGDMQIELIQPLDDISDYAKFLREKGEGVHHICVEADADRLTKTMNERGVPELMSGTIPGVTKFIYFDSAPEIGFTVEFCTDPDV